MLRSAFGLLSPAGPKARLSILIFHRVLGEIDPLFPGEPDVRRFDHIVGWLAKWFRVLPLDQAVARLRAGDLPARAAAITFDDGYADNATNALPILQRHGVPATFFIATSFLDGGRMWNDTVIESVRRAPADTADLAVIGLGPISLRGLEARRSAIGQLLAHVKHMAPAQRGDAVVQIQRALGVDACATPMLTTAQLRGLRDAGMQIGAHTCTHPILARTPDATARDEIVSSKSALEAALQQPVPLFAYPNGKPGSDYTDRHAAMAREAGFDAAVSTAPGTGSCGTDLFQLPRFSPWDRGRARYALRLMNNLRLRSGS